MITDKFLAELSNITVEEWRDICLLRFAKEKLHGGAKEGLKIATDAFFPLIVEEEEEMEILQCADFVEAVGSPPPMIVSDMIPPNSMILISADPKHGKTFFMLQMADDIASGTPLFGKWSVEKPGPVIYLAMEDGKYRFRERIMRRGMDERNPPVFIYPFRKELHTPEGIEWLKKKIEPIQPVLVIIDTARQAFGIGEWNSAGEVTAKLRPLMDAVRTLPNGCSIMVVAHNNKSKDAEGGNRISGSNAIASNSDGYIILSGKRRLINGDVQATGECEGRIDMPSKFFYEMDTNTLHIRVLNDDEADDARRNSKEEAQEKQYERIRRAVIAFNNKATCEGISKHTGLTRQFVGQVVKRMYNEGHLEEAGEKRTMGGGKPAMQYRLPPSTKIGSDETIYNRFNTNPPDQNGNVSTDTETGIKEFFGEEGEEI